MDVWGNLFLGFQVALSPYNLLFCFLGCLFGTLIGVLPGIGDRRDINSYSSHLWVAPHCGPHNDVGPLLRMHVRRVHHVHSR